VKKGRAPPVIFVKQITGMPIGAMATGECNKSVMEKLFYGCVFETQFVFILTSSCGTWNFLKLLTC